MSKRPKLTLPPKKPVDTDWLTSPDIGAKADAIAKRENRVVTPPILGKTTAAA